MDTPNAFILYSSNYSDIRHSSKHVGYFSFFDKIMGLPREAVDTDIQNYTKHFLNSNSDKILSTD